MLVKLLSEQIAYRWDFIKQAIETSVPSMESVDTNELLTDLLNGKAQCWVSHEGEEGSVEGIVVTAIIGDSYSKAKSLLIYALCGYGMNTRKAWADAFKTLAAFAKSEECWRILACTDVSSLIKLAEDLGGNTQRRLVSIPI